MRSVSSNSVFRFRFKGAVVLGKMLIAGTGGVILSPSTEQF